MNPITPPATLVDVRSRMEFAGGHVAGSLNIPLDELRERLDDIKALPQPLWLCCASGNRSGQAQYLLQQQGIECHNAGGWMQANGTLAQMEHQL